MKRKSIVIFACYFSVLLGGGEKEVMLKECPSTPNCVSSESRDKKHYIEPISIADKEGDIKEKLIKVIEEFQGKILEEKGNFLKVAFYSKFFKFEDIADFEIEGDKKVINIRSAAQVGWYDFGVNRKRMENIRKALK